MKILKMNKKDSIIILIGEKGAVFTVHDKKTIKNKIFCENFDEKVQETLSKELETLKGHKIHIVLDILDQSYKKKNFPLMKKGDLQHLINREIASDPDKESIKNYIVLDKINEKSSIKNWQVLFISSSLPSNVKRLLEYIYTLPNQISGIYLYPIESFDLIKDSISCQKDKSSDDIHCLITQTKVSGIRQSIFHNNQILFSRLLDYNIDDASFIRKYEKDLYASYEYLKRIYPEISINNFKIFNIFSDDVIQKITQMKNIEFHIKSLSPFQISQKFNDETNLNQKSRNSDLVFTRSLYKSKKFLLRFYTPYIEKGKKIYLAMRMSYFANLLALLAIGLFTYVSVNKLKKSVEATSVVKIKKANAINELSLTNKKIKLFEKEISENIAPGYSGNEIIDVSKIFEVLKYKDIPPFTEYSRLGFVSSLELKITTFSYNIKNYRQGNPGKTKYSLVITGKILNQSGNVDDIFMTYDKIKSNFIKNFKGYKVDVSELPKNINLAEKYYDFDIKINIDKL